MIKSNKNNILKSLFTIITFLFVISFVNADNWVCYDSTGTVTAEQLKAKMSYQKNSPLQIIKTSGSSSVSYTQSSFFTTCSDLSTVTYCPENQYFLKTSINDAQQCDSFDGAHHQYVTNYQPGCKSNDWNCRAPPLIDGVDCGLGGGPSCNKFSAISGSGAPSYSFVCGKNNDQWKTMKPSSEWECPECQELAERQGGVEPEMGDIKSFRDLSFGDQFKFSGTNIDLSFMVYILACINRVPMVNLQVDLIDKLTGQPVNTEFGIYAKHETLDYNEDNLGMLKDFLIPDQDEFKKTYTIEGTLSAYRAWAWRSRLASAMEKITDKLSLSVPGYPSNKDDLKQGNLYYSPDFLTAKSSLGGAVISDSTKTFLSQKGSINVLKNIGYISGNSMCTIQDLENYVNLNGLTTTLLDEIDEVIPLVPDATYTTAKVSSGTDEDLSYTQNNVRISKSDFIKYYKNVNKWHDKFKKRSKSKQLKELYDMGVITEEQLKNSGRNIVSGWYDYSPDIGCNNFDYTIRDITIVDYDKETKTEFAGWDTYTVQEQYEVEELVNVSQNIIVQYNTTYFNSTTNTTQIMYYNVTETIIVQQLQNVTYTHDVEYQNALTEKVMYLDLDIEAVWENNIVANLELEYEKDIDASYSWDFASLEDLDSEILATCMYNWDACMLKEVKDGKNTYKEVVDCGMGPPSDLAEPTMKDGARGKKTISQDVTVYRSCEDGSDWVSKYKGYSCVDGSYYRCHFAADAGDDILGVTGAGIGDTLIKKDGTGYLCSSTGWLDAACGIGGSVTIPVDEDKKSAEDIIDLINDYQSDLNKFDLFDDNDLNKVLDILYSINNLNSKLSTTTYHQANYASNVLTPVLDYASSGFWTRWFDADVVLNKLTDDLANVESDLTNKVN